MPSESLLIAVAVGPLALAVLACLAALVWALWPQMSAAWARAGLPSVRLVWPQPEEPEPAPTLPLPNVFPVLADDDLERVDATPDDMETAA